MFQPPQQPRGPMPMQDPRLQDTHRRVLGKAQREAQAQQAGPPQDAEQLIGRLLDMLRSDD